METKTCLNDALITFKPDTLLIKREKGFFSLGTSELGGGMGMIKSIVTHSLKSPEGLSPSSFKEGEESLHDFLRANEVSEPAAVTLGNYDLKNGVNLTLDKVTVIIVLDSDNLGVGGCHGFGGGETQRTNSCGTV